jgi:hypothetical protein
MKNMKSAWTFAGGLLLGVTLTFCVGADKDAKKDWSHLQFVGYGSGVTGIFDSATGSYYVYDANMQNCVLTRKLVDLGQPMITP